MTTEAALKRNRGMDAVLILRNWDVTSLMLSGVPTIDTKLSDIKNRIAAKMLLKSRIEVIEVRIGGPGPSVPCVPRPIKKKIAKINVSCTTSSKSSINCHWATVARALTSGMAFPIK